MDLQPRPMENRHVRLEPMGEAHKDDLRAACDADQAIWTELYPYSMAGAHFDVMWDRRMPQDRANGSSIHYAVVAGGRCVGITCFGSIDPVNASADIGGTYYHPDWRGGVVNPSAKRLLLDQAFAAGARRVAFKVDALNTQSRAAVLKLGAVQEAILRQDRVTWTGRVRDTVIFSILKPEWPEIRDRLDTRIASFG